MINAHAATVRALLAAAPPESTPLVVYSGQIPQGAAPPYVRVYIHAESPRESESQSLTGSTAERLMVWIILHCVGANDDAARAVAYRARGALLDVTPTIAGRSCWPIRQESSIPPDPNETTGVMVVDQVDTYRFDSVPI